MMHTKMNENKTAAMFLHQFEQRVLNHEKLTKTIVSEMQRTLMLEDALPSSWRLMVLVWRGTRPYLPYQVLRQLVEKFDVSTTTIEAMAASAATTIDATTIDAMTTAVITNDVMMIVATTTIVTTATVAT